MISENEDIFLEINWSKKECAQKFSEADKIMSDLKKLISKSKGYGKTFSRSVQYIIEEIVNGSIDINNVKPIRVEPPKDVEIKVEKIKLESPTKENISENIDKRRNYAKEYYREYRKGIRRPKDTTISVQNALKEAVNRLSNYRNDQIDKEALIELITDQKSIEKRFNGLIEGDFL